MTTGKTIALTRQGSVGKVISLLFNMLSRLVIAFLPRSKCLLISWLQSPFAVIMESRKIVSHCFHCFPIYLHEAMGPHAMISVFWMLSFKPGFSFSSFTLIKRLFSFSSFSAIRVWLLVTPWTAAHQAPPSMGVSRQEYWSGLPLPSPGDLLNPGIELGSPALQADALTSEPLGKKVKRN